MAGLQSGYQKIHFEKKQARNSRRLDFFLTSDSLSSAITKADILPGYKTDHSLITLHLANNTNPRGPGFWKLNTSFLSDSEYINLIKTTITEVANEYQNNTEVDAVLLWDTMKMQIRSKSIPHAKHERQNEVKRNKSGVCHNVPTEEIGRK